MQNQEYLNTPLSILDYALDFIFKDWLKITSIISYGNEELMIKNIENNLLL